jgi:MoaA/NifB/PqqE/SkfB family radical SAM enzyme
MTWRSEFCCKRGLLVPVVLEVADPRFARIDADSLVAQTDPQRQRRLFARLVGMVEVEVHSYCNRTCWFCPNSYIDRRTETKLMDEAVYTRLLADLGEIGFAGVITYSRYNEPFAHDSFYTRLAQARQAVPDATLHTNTNSDYLTDETLARAYDSGLRSLNCQIYLPEEFPFSRENVAVIGGRIRSKIATASFDLTRQDPDWIEYTGHYRDMALRLYARDFNVNGVRRANVRIGKLRPRSCPCLQPFFSVYIDYTGDVMPCCNLRSDVPEHQCGILGRIDREPGSVFRIFAGDLAAAWRREMVPWEPKRSPCDECNFDEITETPANRRATDRLAALANAQRQ